MDMKLRVSVRSIGVVGLSWSGKTVLLTSLIDHLNNHDPLAFPIVNQTTGHPPEVLRFKELNPDQGWKAFPYQRYRKLLVDGLAWPAKATGRWNSTGCSG